MFTLASALVKSSSVKSNMSKQKDAPASGAAAAASGAPVGKKRDTLFLNDSSSIGGFSFGFTDGHLPVSSVGGADEALGASAVAEDDQQTPSGKKQPDEEAGEDETLLLFKQQHVGGEAVAISLEQLEAAKRDVEGAGFAFFFPQQAHQKAKGGSNSSSKPLPPLDPQAHVANIRRIFTQTRQEVALAELRRKKASGSADHDDE
jgi:hypothetical protein